MPAWVLKGRAWGGAGCVAIQGTSLSTVSSTVDFGSPSSRAPEPRRHQSMVNFPALPLGWCYWERYDSLHFHENRQKVSICMGFLNFPTRHGFGSFACNVRQPIFDWNSLRHFGADVWRSNRSRPILFWGCKSTKLQSTGEPVGCLRPNASVSSRIPGKMAWQTGSKSNGQTWCANTQHCQIISNYMDVLRRTIQVCWWFMMSFCEL